MERTKKQIMRLCVIALVLPLFFLACKKDKDKDEDDIKVVPPITATDIDGNIYPSVTIGTQVWMAENLKTSRLTDGTVMENFSGFS